MRRITALLVAAILLCLPIPAEAHGPYITSGVVHWGNYSCDYTVGNQAHADATGRAIAMTANDGCQLSGVPTANRVLGTFIEVGSVIPGIPSTYSFPAFLGNFTAINWDWNAGGFYANGIIKVHVRVCNYSTGNCGADSAV